MTTTPRWTCLILCALVATACGPRPAEPPRGGAPAATVAASSPDAQAEQAVEAVAAYFAGAELQAETDKQRAEVRRALVDLIEQPAAALRDARYAGPDGTPAQRDLAQLLRGHFAPSSPHPLDLDTLIAAKSSPRLVAVVRGRLDALGAAAAAPSAPGR